MNEYEPEVWRVRKDVIYAAIDALSLALAYSPMIKKDIPHWLQKTFDGEVLRLQNTLADLRKCGPREDRPDEDPTPAISQVS